MSQAGRRARTGLFALLAVVIGGALAASPASAQYFGRNKVQYERFHFKVLHTEHFDIYFYPSEEEGARDLGRMAERWYTRYVRIFRHHPTERKPVILYANHADFEQTNVGGGFIGQETGGFTESLKNRVVMPLTGDYAADDHVIGHELVHVFQYDIASVAEDSVGFNINRMPLWMIEGMAEYLSIGRDDPNTAMWMRDALLQKDFPTLKQLSTDPKYFPYRYGEALWAFLAGRWGDDKVVSIYRAMGLRSMDYAFLRYTGMNGDSLSTVWKNAVASAYLPAMAGRADPDSVGKKILAPDLDAGQMNLAPAVSPDGTRVAFLSEKDLFSIDLFVADAATGKILRKLASSASNPHYDSLRFIDSAGSWSPDGKLLAFVVFIKGDNAIAIVDAETGKFERSVRVPEAHGISNPAWSPDGSRILFSGTSGGVSDLYTYNLETGAVRQLTNDRYADLEPTWSPDGTTIAWVTDRGSRTSFQDLTYSEKGIGLMNADGSDVRWLAPFKGFKHIDPQFGPGGKTIFFISDRDGFSDVYRMNLEGGDLRQVTNVATGVSGITDLSPAMSLSREGGRLMFSVFVKGNYNVMAVEGDRLRGEPVKPLAVTPELPPVAADSAAAADSLRARASGAAAGSNGVDGAGGGRAQRNAPAAPSTGTEASGGGAAIPARPVHTDTLTVLTTPGNAAPDGKHVTFTATADTSGVRPPPPPVTVDKPWNLPPETPWVKSAVAAYHDDPFTGLPTTSDFATSRYHPHLQLDYIGAVTAGVAVDRYGVGIGGGVSGYFSDMLGNHEVGAALQANGGIKDVGGQVIYINRTHRWNWGASLEHIPYLSVLTGYAIQGDSTVTQQIRDRVFVDSASLLAAYPFSTTRRIEASAGFTHLGYNREVETLTTDLNTGFSTDRITSGQAPPGLSLIEGELAYVGDYSYFGFCSPIKGGRYRVELDPTFGTLQFETVLADFRHYFFFNPVTVAMRGIHVGRYGPDSESDRINPLFLGYETLVRGYSSGSFSLSECGNDPNCPSFNRLFGSRIAVANLEVRLPVLGTKQFGLLNFPYAPTELSAFLDGGVAWTRDQGPVLKLSHSSSETGSLERTPVFSTGLSARVNVLGALILEIYYAYPFQRPQKGAHFGFQIAPGW